MPGPLSDIRVIDLSRVLAGPYAAMTLGDMGAEVIKVEQPGDGDETRGWGPPWAGGESAYYLSANRNKQGITLNLKAAGGKQALLDLVAKSDVLVENFKRGTLERMGLGDEVLWAVNPRLIHAAITGFGPVGPYADYPGYDFIVQAMAGIMSITGEPGGEPMKVGVAIVDITAGLFALNGVLAALHERERTGKGQRVDVSLLESALAWLANVGSNYLVSGDPPKRYGNAHPNIVPYQPFRAADRPLAIAVANPRQVSRFFELAGRPELATDERFATNAGRLAHRDELIAEVQAIVAQRPADEWLKLLNDNGIPAGPINTIPQALADPQVQALGMVRELPHPTAGAVKVIGSPVRMSAGKVGPRTAPPLLGEHTEQVLRGLLGYDEQKMAALRAEQAI